MEIKLILGDITASDADAIVNAANTKLKAGSGVCGAIFRAAGYFELQKECDKYSPINTGDAVITSGYNLKAKYIIHTAGPIYKDDTSSIYLRNSYYNSLKLAYSKNLRTIAFPSISTGIYGYPLDKASVIAIDAIYEFNKDYPENNMVVYFYFIDEYTYSFYEKYLNKR
jgi:O-acetyl-ADP-ribose deacetylase (regulator of RNase III)